jgi:hypothetical protein
LAKHTGAEMSENNPNEFSVKMLIRSGSLCMDSLINALEGDGYITEKQHPIDCALHRVGLEAITQERFAEAFRFLYPGTLNTISIECTATNKGGDGAFSYAIFNSNRIKREAVDAVLVLENRQTAPDPPS